VVVCLVADVVGSVESAIRPRIGGTGQAAWLSCDDAQPSTHCDPLHGVLVQGDAPPTTIEPANRARRSAGPTRLPREGSSPRQLSANLPLTTSATATPRPAYREAREQPVPWKMGSFCAQVGRESHEHEHSTAHARPVAGAQCRSIGSGRISRTTGSEATGRAGQQACWTTREHLRIDADSKRRQVDNPVPRASPSGRISLHLRTQALATPAIRTVQIDGSVRTAAAHGTWPARTGRSMRVSPTMCGSRHGLHTRLGVDMCR
jgi:hypothetical protein